MGKFAKYWQGLFSVSGNSGIVVQPMKDAVKAEFKLEDSLFENEFEANAESHEEFRKLKREAQMGDPAYTNLGTILERLGIDGRHYTDPRKLRGLSDLGIETQEGLFVYPLPILIPSTIDDNLITFKDITRQAFTRLYSDIETEDTLEMFLAGQDMNEATKQITLSTTMGAYIKVKSMVSREVYRNFEKALTKDAT